MTTPTLLHPSIRRFAAAFLAATVMSGCSAMVARPAAPLTVARDEPGVLVCMSARTSGGGLRLIGQLNAGIYTITGATLQYRLAGPADDVPATHDGNNLEFVGARSEKVPVRKGAGEVVYTIDADAARALSGKVLWYRWTILYDKGSSQHEDETDIHRTSLEEAGLPRAPGNPGPDTSVALPGSHRR